MYHTNDKNTFMKYAWGIPEAIVG